MKTFENQKLYVCTPEDMKEQWKKFSTVYHLRIFHPHTNKAFLKHVKMYNCPTWNSQNARKDRKLSYDWKIAGAMMPDSVFILKRRKGTPVICENAGLTGCQYKYKSSYEIVAMVKYLYPQYISYII